MPATASASRALRTLVMKGSAVRIRSSALPHARAQAMASTPLPTLPVSPAIDQDRPALVRRARQLAWWGVGWHAIEATVAIAAGVAASSVALVGFGADSLVESIAGFVVVWRFASARASSEHAERRAQKLIAASFCLIAMYVGVEAVRSLTGGREPAASWVGI